MSVVSHYRSLFIPYRLRRSSRDKSKGFKSESYPLHDSPTEVYRLSTFVLRPDPVSSRLTIRPLSSVSGSDTRPEVMSGTTTLVTETTIQVRRTLGCVDGTVTPLVFCLTQPERPRFCHGTTGDLRRFRPTPVFLLLNSGGPVSL